MVNIGSITIICDALDVFLRDFNDYFTTHVGYRHADSVHDNTLHCAIVCSDFHDKMSQIESVAAVPDVAHVRIPRVCLGALRHVRAQGNWQARGKPVLRVPFILCTLLDRCVGGCSVHGPMAVRRRHVHYALSTQYRITARQDFQPVYYHIINHLPHIWSQPTCTEDVVSMVTL